jgi:hypothetical protein
MELFLGTHSGQTDEHAGHLPEFTAQAAPGCHPREKAIHDVGLDLLKAFCFKISGSDFNFGEQEMIFFWLGAHKGIYRTEHGRVDNDIAGMGLLLGI